MTVFREDSDELGMAQFASVFSRSRKFSQSGKYLNVDSPNTWRYDI